MRGQEKSGGETNPALGGLYSESQLSSQVLQQTKRADVQRLPGETKLKFP